jgi:hypothetical protein
MARLDERHVVVKNPWRASATVATVAIFCILGAGSVAGTGRGGKVSSHGR